MSAWQHASIKMLLNSDLVGSLVHKILVTFTGHIIKLFSFYKLRLFVISKYLTLADISEWSTFQVLHSKVSSWPYI
jgi:hypothetical protein